ncbi:MAG: hypothetical protein R2877_07230 [Bdellovibrionota bacterium]
MTFKNIQIVLLMTAAIGFQACGNVSNEGFTETDISNQQLTPGIQEGLCEETETEFVFKSSVSAPGTNQQFKKGNGIFVGPDGQEYAIEETAEAKMNQNIPEAYDCTLEVFNNGDFEITSLEKISDGPSRFVHGVAMVN